MAFGAILRSGKRSGLDKVVAYNLGIARCRDISLAKMEVVGLANVVRVVFSSIVQVRLSLGSVDAEVVVVRRFRLRGRIFAGGIPVRLGLRRGAPGALVRRRLWRRVGILGGIVVGRRLCR